MSTDYSDCENISAQCPVEGSIYGYYPSYAGNIFFVAIFGVCMIVQLFQGLKWRTYTFAIALVFGCMGEAIGT